MSRRASTTGAEGQISIPDLLAAYGAALASLLGVIRLVEFWESRKRIHFAVAHSVLFSGGLVPDRTNVITIHVGNRGPIPIHLSSIGFLLKDRKGLLFQQIAELQFSQQLPSKVEPSEGFVMGVLPAKLGESLGGADGVRKLAQVYCTDGSGRTYERRLTRRETQQIRKAIEESGT